MRLPRAVMAALALAAVARAAGNSSTPVYKNATATIDDRVADLLGRMTVADKTAQLMQGDMTSWLNTSDGSFNASGLRWNLDARGGSFYVGYAVNWTTLSAAVRAGQDYLARNTTLGIPAWVQSEGIHGVLVPNATIFNSPIGQACAWNRGLVERMGRAIADEARALGVNNILGPLADLARELRYGRVEETFGEDAFLAGEMAYSFVAGLQAGRVAAMVKHFAAAASPEQGLNTAPVHGGERELRTTYLPPFRRAIVDAGAVAVMSAYHCYDGVPAVADPRLLTDILRGAWGYEYFVMSDAGATDRVCTAFGLCRAAPIDSDAVVAAVLPAGTDVEMGGGSYNFARIPAMVAAGTLDEALLDRAVARLLRAKFRMGLFETPFAGVAAADLARHVHTNATQQLARQLDAESIVLLENRAATLPLRRDAAIAVIGPMASGPINYGDYVPFQSSQRGVSPLAGIRAAATGPVTYAQGCERWSNDDAGFAEAVAAAAAADVAVVVVGTWSRDQGELWTGLNATTGEHIDAADLRLVGAMPRLVAAVIASGTPTVVVYSSGKPVTEPWISARASALVQQFYPSEQGGHALADVLFGAHNPSGRLSVSFPYDVGATPIYYDYLNSARSYPNPGHVYPNGTLVFGSSYVLQSPLPLYEFGYGLSYSTFRYAPTLTLSRTTATANDTVTVTVAVTNDSPRDGTEVVQVYVRDDIASVVVPNKQLRGFDKVAIAAGATVAVSIDIAVADLGLWDARMRYVVEPGNFTVYAGRSSADLRASATLTVV